jgi:fluoroquinolone resistance protein
VEADFSDCNLTKCDFSGTVFSGANLRGVDLSGANLKNSKDYIFDLRTTKIKGAQFSFPYVMSLITALGGKVEM